MKESICGLDCGVCGLNKTCAGCSSAKGKPFGGECMLAACCLSKGQEGCGDCVSNCKDGECEMKKQLIAEFNELSIKDMPEVTDLNALWGEYINLEYTMPGGQQVKLWDDNRIYLGNQLCKKNSDRCYGLTADENYLLVCEYGENGTDAQIVVYKRRKQV